MSEPILTERFVRALELTHGYHLSQVRKRTEIPYLSHLLQVAGLVLEAGGDEDEAIAALLHDAIEDGDTVEEAGRREREIEREFGERVLSLVRGCTDGDPAEKRRLRWIDRKLRYLGHLGDAADAVLLISVCDKLHNARAILRDLRSDGEALWDRFAGKRLGSLWYYRALVEAYRARGSVPFVDELDEVVGTIEREAGRPDGVALEEVRRAMPPRPVEA